MGLLLLIPGIVLLATEGNHWFSGQGTVGLVLTLVGVAIIVLQLLAFAFMAAGAKKMMK